MKESYTGRKGPLQMANIGSMDDIQSLFKETLAEFLENVAWRPSWATANTTAFGDVDVSVPQDRKGEFGMDPLAVSGHIVMCFKRYLYRTHIS